MTRGVLFGYVAAGKVFFLIQLRAVSVLEDKGNLISGDQIVRSKLKGNTFTDSE